MAKEEWGLKHICPNCGSKFYDFYKDPILCPACGTQIIVAASESVTLDSDPDSETGMADDASDPIDEAEDTDVEIDENVLDDTDDDTMSLDEITDMPSEDDET